MVFPLLQGYLSQSHNPELVRLAARLMLAGAALGGAVAWRYWPGICRAASRILAAIAAVEDLSFWSVVILAGVLLRLVALLCLPLHPTSDALWYHQTAASLAAGSGLTVAGQSTAYRPPGYPFLLSLFYRLSGVHVEAAWLLGLSATVLLIAAVYGLGCRWYGRLPARISALIAVLYPALVLETSLTMSDLAFAAGVAGLVWWASTRPPLRARDTLLAGAAAAALALTRGIGLGLFPLAALVWGLRTRDWRRSAGAALLSGLAMVLCLVPWALRNQRVVGRPVLATNFGVNLYVGHHPGATGGYTRPELRGAESGDEASFDAALGREAWAYIAHHPWQELAVIPRKLLHLYLLETGAVTILFQGTTQRAGALRMVLYGISQAGYLLLLLPFVTRVIRRRYDRERAAPDRWTGWLLILYFTGVTLLFFGDSRFRLPILPWMILEVGALAAAPGDAQGGAPEPAPTRG